MKSVLTSILIAIAVLAVAGVAYYFLFMAGPAVDLTPTVRTEAYVPTIDIAVMDDPVFKALKSYSALPIAVSAVGNSLPFSEKIFLKESVPEETAEEGAVAPTL